MFKDEGLDYDGLPVDYYYDDEADGGYDDETQANSIITDEVDLASSSQLKRVRDDDEELEMILIQKNMPEPRRDNI